MAKTAQSGNDTAKGLAEANYDQYKTIASRASTSSRSTIAAQAVPKLMDPTSFDPAPSFSLPPPLVFAFLFSLFSVLCFLAFPFSLLPLPVLAFLYLLFSVFLFSLPSPHYLLLWLKHKKPRQYGHCVRFNTSNIEFSGSERRPEDYVLIDVSFTLRSVCMGGL